MRENAQETRNNDLFLAACRGDAESCLDLLAKGARPDAHKNIDQKTALMLAAEKEYAHIVQVLIEHGADVNLKDQFDQTALHAVAINDCSDTQTLDMLLKAGADTTAQDYSGMTPLMLAHTGPKTICLLKANADIINMQSKNRSTAIMLALRHAQLGVGDENCVIALFEAGADIDTLKDYQGYTALDYYNESRCPDSITKLFKAAQFRTAAEKGTPRRRKIIRPVKTVPGVS
ncbi:MAG: ankyrin repeat domain-containing protein [Alphaproteobacteria bacterium]|nr:ankyrin repeat domain-containing protein [Alphaproteobacteria bacterium]